MVSFLDGPLAKAIHSGFKGKLLSGVLTRVGASTTVDSNNDPVGGSPQSFPFEGFVDAFSSQFRAQNGIPDTDLKITIIANSISTEPSKDDKVEFTRATGNENYQIRKILEIDPARATYTCQGYMINGT